jgi:hypothetical protein
MNERQCCLSGSKTVSERQIAIPHLSQQEFAGRDIGIKSTGTNGGIPQDSLLVECTALPTAAAFSWS